MTMNLKELVLGYKVDPELVYNTWFSDNDIHGCFSMARRIVVTYSLGR